MEKQPGRSCSLPVARLPNMDGFHTGDDSTEVDPGRPWRARMAWPSTGAVRGSIAATDLLIDASNVGDRSVLAEMSEESQLNVDEQRELY